MMTADQKARNLLKRMGVDGVQELSVDDLSELVNLIAENERLSALIEMLKIELTQGPDKGPYIATGNPGDVRLSHGMPGDWPI